MILNKKSSTYLVQLPLNLFHFVILILTAKCLTFLLNDIAKYCGSLIHPSIGRLHLCPKLCFWYKYDDCSLYIAVHFPPAGIQLNPCKDITPSPNRFISVFYATYNLMFMFSLCFAVFSDLEVIHWWFLPALSRWAASAREASRKFDRNLMKSWDRVTHRQNTLNLMVWIKYRYIWNITRGREHIIMSKRTAFVVCL